MPSNLNHPYSGLLPKERQHKSDEVVHQVSGTTTVERLSEEILELRREISTLREKNLVLQEEIRKFKSSKLYDQSGWLGDIYINNHDCSQH